jgi:hypothetical protein
LSDGTESLAQAKVAPFDDHFNDPFHPVLEDPLWPGHVKQLQSVAGTDVTDQIGESVARSANVADPIPSWKRNIIGGDPESFSPDYENDKGAPTAGDIAEKESLEKGKALKEAAAAKAAEEAEAAASKAKEEKRIADARLADKLAKPATTVAEKEEKEKLIKETEAKAEEKTAETTKKIAEEMKKMEDESGDKK